MHHAQPDAPRRARAGERRDRELAALLDWYREHAPHNKCWKLIIAGDFVDFAGMSVPYELSTETAPTEEERLNGLGNARDHTLAKLRLVMEHDSVVMVSLARFVAAGNSLVIVRGNHDVDWHWEPVQEEFRLGLARHAPVQREQVEFAPWFYYEEGVLFVEHGHQYDTYCSYEHVLHPVLPSDPSRTVRSLSEILLRYVVRPTRGLSEAGHAAASLLDYVRFAFRLGLKGMWGLAARFAYAIRAVVSLWREHVSEAAHRVRREHDARLEALGLRHRIQVERLVALARLWRPPITRRLFPILSVLMLDRVLLALTGVVLVCALLVGIDELWLGSAASFAAVSTLGGLGVFSRTLRKSIEPSAELRESSALVARLFPAAFIVMGHTHLPESLLATEQTTYVNLGAWAEEDAPEGHLPALPATRTHLVLATAESGPTAELLIWGENGPRPFVPAPSKSSPLELFDRG